MLLNKTDKNPRFHGTYIPVGRDRQQKIDVKKIEKLHSILGDKHYAKTEQGGKIRVEILYSLNRVAWVCLRK